MARAPEYLKRIPNCDVTKNGFFSDLKTHIGRVAEGEFFWQLAHG